MPVKIRLSRKGRKKAPFYHIVVADARAPRDGKFIEKIGTYNPMTKPATIEIDRMAAFNWLENGAQPTDTVKAILRFKGVYFRKHLMRGFKKGALTMEQVDSAWAAWIEHKENKIESRRAQTKADIDLFRKQVSGEAKVVKPVLDQETVASAEAFKVHEDAPESVSEVVENVVEEVTEVAEATEAVVENAVEEVADAAESAAEEIADEASEEA
ncbi:MAG: 30S ribosomal protein S16 [Saprospiraceae bacterium]|nr:30S ribosomal protein S16 [Saprospiraceae bacterium]